MLIVDGASVAAAEGISSKIMKDNDSTIECVAVYTCDTHSLAPPAGACKLTGSLEMQFLFSVRLRPAPSRQLRASGTF